MRSLVAAAFLVVSCAPAPEPADLVLRGGRIVTLDPSRPEADALAARGDRIVAVGTDAEIAPFVGPETEVIELEGRLAVPGFVEGHGHFSGLGRALDTLDLRSARTWDEVVARVAAEAARRPGLARVRRVVRHVTGDRGAIRSGVVPIVHHGEAGRRPG